MMPSDRHDAACDAGIAVEKGALWRRRNRRRLLSHLETGPSIQGIGGRVLNVPANTKIKSEAREDWEIILCEEPGTPAVGVAGHRRILRNGSWQAHHEMGEGRNRKGFAGLGVFYVRAVESKHAVVVQQGLLNILVQSFVGSEGKRMAPVRIADHVAHGVK